MTARCHCRMSGPRRPPCRSVMETGKQSETEWQTGVHSPSWGKASVRNLEVNTYSVSLAKHPRLVQRKDKEVGSGN